MAVVEDSQVPVDVVTINDQVVQVDSPDGLRVSISALSDGGELLPIDPTGKIIVEESQKFFVSGKGFSGGTEVVVWLFSTPRRLGLLPVSPSGEFAGDFEVDKSIEIGDHTVQVNGLDTKGSIRSLNLDLEVRKPSTVLAPLPSVETRTSDGTFIWWPWAVAAIVLGGGYWAVRGRRRRRDEDAQTL